MKPKIFCQTPSGQKTSATLLIKSHLSDFCEVIDDELKALADPKVIFVNFVTTIKEDLLLGFLDQQKIITPKHQIVFIGPGIDVHLKYKLFLAGLDQFLPLNIAETPTYLLKQIYGLANRKNQMANTTRLLSIGDLTLDPLNRHVKRQNQVIPLRNKEFELLKYLIERPNQTVSRNQLLESVWGYSYQVISNTVQSHMVNLRKKIDAGFAAPLIHTFYKHGYMLSDKT